MESQPDRKLGSPVVGPAFPPEWRRYRDGYAVLQHVASLAADRARVSADVGGLARDLGLEREECSAVVEYLVWNRHLRYEQSGMRVAVTPQGAEYLRTSAGRRRSVRPLDPRPFRTAASLATPTARWGRRFQHDAVPWHSAVPAVPPGQ